MSLAILHAKGIFFICKMMDGVIPWIPRTFLKLGKLELQLARAIIPNSLHTHTLPLCTPDQFPSALLILSHCLCRAVQKYRGAETEVLGAKQAPWTHLLSEINIYFIIRCIPDLVTTELEKSLLQRS